MGMKLLAWLFVAMVTVGMLPLVIAEEGRGDDGSEVSGETEIRTETRDDDSGIRVETRERIRDGERVLEFRERVRDAQGDVLEIRERVREERDRYKELRLAYDERRDAVIDAKARIEQRCRGSTATACVQLRTEFSLRAQEFLLAAAGKVLNHLDRLEQFVETHTDDAEVQAELLADIGEVQVSVEAVIADIESLPENATAAELAEARQQVHDVWQDALQLTREIKANLTLHKVQLSTRKMVNLEERLYSVRDDLEAAGADVSELNGLLEEFSFHLDAAASAETAEDSREHFKEAVHLLREIMHEIRDLRQELRGEADDAVEELSDDSAEDAESEDDSNKDSESENDVNESEEESSESNEELEVNASATVTV